MHFNSHTSSNGIIERHFTLDDVTGVFWSSADASDGAPLILMGHGGGLHKKAPGLVARAHHCVTTGGFTVAAIDAPGHGERPRNAADKQWVAALRQARSAGEPIGSIVIDFNASLAERAVPEWQATIDALQALPEIGTGAPVGYIGMTLATAIGIPLMAVDWRIAAATFGAMFASDSLKAAAKRITAPIEFLLPWDDKEIPREHGLALFDAFASSEKLLRAFPGGHRQVPSFAVEGSAPFFTRHLGRAG
jgi:pimeloyl-ACP methyl ester carboxylesterase